MQLESGLPILESGAEASHEILVSVGGVELHQRNPIFGSGEAVRKRLRDVGLSRAWGSLEDDLALVVKQGFDFFNKIGG